MYIVQGKSNFIDYEYDTLPGGAYGKQVNVLYYTSTGHF
jgi:hypothetical protein